MHEEEKARLAAISERVAYSFDTDVAACAYERGIFLRYCKPGAVLKMGIGESKDLEKINEKADKLDLLDGDPTLCERGREKLPKCRFFCSLAEDFEPDCSYDSIYIGHLLEHVIDPVAILSRATAWLAPGGLIFASVPNAMSIHRQAATIMGMLPCENSLNKRDLSIGHRRVYTPSEFHNCLRASKLEILHTGGYFLKSMSSTQMSEAISPEGMLAFMKLGERYPDVAANIFAVAALGKK